jgi:hypothetical protein
MAEQETSPRSPCESKGSVKVLNASAAHLVLWARARDGSGGGTFA